VIRRMSSFVIHLDPSHSPILLMQFHMINKSYDNTGLSEESTRLSDTPGSRLIVSTESDGKLFEWFEITDSLIEVITLDMFLDKVGKFFCTSSSVMVHDIDGPINTTADLRRSLRSLAPFITVRSPINSPDQIRYPPPVPIARLHSSRR